MFTDSGWQERKVGQTGWSTKRVKLTVSAELARSLNQKYGVSIRANVATEFVYQFRSFSYRRARYKDFYRCKWAPSLNNGQGGWQWQYYQAEKCQQDGEAHFSMPSYMGDLLGWPQSTTRWIPEPPSCEIIHPQR